MQNGNRNNSNNFWQNKKVCVTGGAAMIGAELVSQLLALNPAELWVVDDLSSGKRENLPKDVELAVCDLREYSNALMWMQGADVVIHLACQHGGRGYVATHKLACYDNLSLDGTVFRAAHAADVGKVVFASSACVYPTHIQQDQDTELYLSEPLVNEQDGMRPDNSYGWSKLSAEFTLNAYVEETKMRGVSTRFFTVYGKYMKENHAICALIAKSLIKLDPFPVWGTGEQIRNWGHVTDIARGMTLAAEKMDCGAVNIGVEEKYTPNIACELIWDIMGWRPREVEYQLDKPVGVINRVADAKKAHDLLDWYPQKTFRQGLEETIEWYASSHNINAVRDGLERSLTER